jgi:Protein of unknown function (DUF3122)
MNLKKVPIFLVVISLIFAILLIFNPVANANLTKYQESSGLTRYNSKHSLKDKTGYSWQIVLFPVISGGNNNYYLRLVGFPGIVELKHPQSLEIITSEGKILIANDLFSEESPAPNVGQFDVTNLVKELPEKGFLKLVLPLKNNQELSLKLPSSILLEWQWLVKEI